jgi:hypothetical protein
LGYLATSSFWYSSALAGFAFPPASSARIISRSPSEARSASADASFRCEKKSLAVAELAASW